MSRQIKGHVEFRGGRWQVQATDASGARKWYNLDASIRQEQRELAQAVGTAFAKRLRSGDHVPTECEETVAEYFKRWNEMRLAKYPRQAKADESVFRLWVSERLGALPIRRVTREHLIELSHHLDTLAAKGEDFAEKRARNIFSVVAAMFRDAYSHKSAALRVLEANPCDGVPWPERSETQALKQLLYPNEFLALVECPNVPVLRARLYAVTLYTTTRAAEVRVFEPQHFDVEHGSVQILMSESADGGTKSTKSGKARLATLEATLAPVVSAMLDERSFGRLFPSRPKTAPKGNQWRPASDEYIPRPDGEYGLCATFKRDLRVALEWAGVAIRPELFDDSDRRKSISIRFHDLRASGITWRHARGDNPAEILQQCGHEDQATNAIYIRTLRGLARGSLFPVLPKRLLGNRPGIAQSPNVTPVFTTNLVGAEGLEPPTSTV